jgi:hypothetical protein
MGPWPMSLAFHFAEKCNWFHQDRNQKWKLSYWYHHFWFLFFKLILYKLGNAKPHQMYIFFEGSTFPSECHKTDFAEASYKMGSKLAEMTILLHKKKPSSACSTSPWYHMNRDVHANNMNEYSIMPITKRHWDQTLWVISYINFWIEDTIWVLTRLEPVMFGTNCLAWTQQHTFPLCYLPSQKR